MGDAYLAGVFISDILGPFGQLLAAGAGRLGAENLYF